MINLGLINEQEKKLKKQYKYLDEIALFNQEKVLNAFKKNKIALRHFSGTTGYGYGDEGRDTLNSLFADIFGAENAICSPQIVSGTHALSLSLYGVLRPGDKVLFITGKPYDTLSDVLYGKGTGSLEDFGVSFDFIPLKEDSIDYDSISNYFLNNFL